MSEIPVYEAATAPPPKRLTPDEMEILQLCNFERYRDLVDKRRLGVSERDHLDQLDDWWDALFDRKSLPPTESPAQQAHAAVGYTYEGTLTVEGETEAKPAKAGKRGLDLETVSEETLLSKVASLGKEDRDRLDKMAEDFSIQGYCHLLDILRREDDEIKRNQDAIDRKKKIPKKVRRRMRDREGKARSSHRSGSPSYDAMGYEVITTLLVCSALSPHPTSYFVSSYFRHPGNSHLTPRMRRQTAATRVTRRKRRSQVRPTPPLSLLPSFRRGHPGRVVMRWRQGPRSPSTCGR